MTVCTRGVETCLTTVAPTRLQSHLEGLAPDKPFVSADEHGFDEYELAHVRDTGISRWAWQLIMYFT